MISSYFGLLVHTSLVTAIPVLDNGMGEKVSGPESVVNDFAVLTGNNLGTLPPDFSICSSIATRAFLGFMAPFQLLYNDGKPWITVRTDLALKDQTRHKIIFYVSFCYASPLISQSGKLKKAFFRRAHPPLQL